MSAVHSRAIFQKRRYPTDRGGLDSAHGHWQNYFHVTRATTQHNDRCGITYPNGVDTQPFAGAVAGGT